MFDQYSLPLVALSYVISVFGSFAALQLVTGITEAVVKVDRQRAIGLAGLALGGGAIWSMHFVGMMALKSHMPMSYDVFKTLLSVVIAVAACTGGLAIVGTGRFTIDKLLPTSILTGIGVAGMHYMGMEAMLMPAEIQYNLNILIISVVIAVAAAFAALWMAFHLHGVWQKLGSALIMGVAVCGMHYTGMAAASYQHTGVMPEAGFAGALSDEYMGVVTVVISIGIIAMALAVNHWYRNRVLLPQ
ncbi:MHYT domain-containing protein [uncultured Microbulbifer sp.]|uniref:MHYT domain-containing protein n=1 Tax=uncultured Microbulbifer sp. TaxID=348147 RepID=UPI00261C22A7|nr:MHYT domain-containing protein [uncultured Microbulbifer sp.]